MAAVILKIPFDLGIMNKEHRGTSLAPDAIQKTLKADFKDVKVFEDFEATQKSICSAAKKEYSKNNFVIGLGGDHSVSYGLMKAFSEKFKGALLFFDAHPDALDDFSPPSHEDIIKAAVNKKFFNPKNILMVGVRKWEPEEKEFVKKKGIQVGTLSDVPAFLGKHKNVYATIDIDAVDPSDAPGTGWPVPNGLNSEELLDTLKLLKKSGKLRGMDLVEVSPPIDINGTTCKLAKRFLTVFTV